MKPKTKMVSKTVWDWELMNETKPIWQRPTKEISDEEYDEFYKAISKVALFNQLYYFWGVAEGFGGESRLILYFTLES